MLTVEAVVPITSALAAVAQVVKSGAKEHRAQWNDDGVYRSVEKAEKHVV